MTNLLTTATKNTVQAQQYGTHPDPVTDLTNLLTTATKNTIQAQQYGTPPDPVTDLTNLTTAMKKTVLAQLEEKTSRRLQADHDQAALVNGRIG